MMCDVVRPDGTVVPTYELDDRTAACLLDAMQGWRYPVVDACWPPTGWAEIGGRSRNQTPGVWPMPGVWPDILKPEGCG